MNAYVLTVVHHWPAVLASAVLAVLATYVALEFAGRIHRATDRLAKRLWLCVGAVAMGSGIWATHFVGMAAASYPFQAAYEVRMTLASWICGVLASVAVLVAAARRDPDRAMWLFPALLGGLLATAMHYLGTEALVVSPAVVYHHGLAAAAALVMMAGSAGTVALFRARREADDGRRTRLQLTTASVFGGSLAVMHYVGMASTGFAADTICLSRGLDVGLLGGTVGFATFVFLAMMLVMTTLERWTDQRVKRLDGSLDRVREKLHYVTFNDPVTGLPNRLVFQDRLKQAVARADRSGESLAVVFVDLDGFKAVDHSWTDSHGEDTLRHVAAVLEDVIRESDSVANVGGDHFLLLMEKVDDAPVAAQVAERIAAVLHSSCSLAPNAPRVTASIGISVYPADGSSSRLVGNASVAARAAHAEGGNGYRFFEAGMNAEAHAKSRWLDQLRQAVEVGAFELHYQPKVFAQTGRIAGAEALLRWRQADGSLVSPAVFIPLAEQYGLINAIGSWVIEEACRQMGVWQAAGVTKRIAINLSVHQLRQPGLAAEIARALARHAIDPSHLTCEITESDAMEDSVATIDRLERLRATGVALSIDDFGTGYSSLSYLRRMPVRQLKIDQSFVGDLERSDDARAIVEAIIDLAHALRLEVVAEGVETDAQRDILLALGCDKLQGYLFSRPLPPDEFFRVVTTEAARADAFIASLFEPA